MVSTDSSRIVPSRILVPVDFSPSSHLAVETAAGLAENFGAELYLLHVVTEVAGFVLPDGVTQESIMDKTKSIANEQFQNALADLKSERLKVKACVEAGGDVVGTILDVIEREHIDMLVIPTHGLSGWYPAVFGAVTEKLLRLVECPVFLVRTPQPESSLQTRMLPAMEWWTARIPKIAMSK